MQKSFIAPKRRNVTDFYIDVQTYDELTLATVKLSLQLSTVDGEDSMCWDIEHNVYWYRIYFLSYHRLKAYLDANLHSFINLDIRFLPSDQTNDVWAALEQLARPALPPINQL